jgi:hypothetical protein
MLLNKTDLVTEADLKRVEGRLREINKFAPIQRCTKSQVSVDSVLNIRGFDLNRTLEMDPEFLNTDGEHVHDASITSLSIIQPGVVDLDAVQEWIANLLQEKGKDIFRTKGVIAIAHSAQKFVYQAVHMIFNGSFEEEEWGDDELRESKLVFIGKNLDKEELKAGFAACIETPELLEKKRKALRFAIGDRVECSIGKDEVAQGVVVAQFFHHEDLGPGMCAPYQVRLDDGDLIFAPADHESCIRSAKATGINFPIKKKTAKKANAKATGAKAATTTKTAAKKTAAKKTVAKKTVAKKTVAKKTITKKATK